jgi:hypothetical protein
LTKINNKAKVRRSTRPDILGTARMMSYKDLEKARADRATKEVAKEAKKATKEAKKATKEAKKATKEAKKIASATLEAEKATAGKGKRGWKRKSPAEADAPEPKAKLMRTSGTQIAEGETAPTPWTAPVARMY